MELPSFSIALVERTIRIGSLNKRKRRRRHLRSIDLPSKQNAMSEIDDPKKTPRSVRLDRFNFCLGFPFNFFFSFTMPFSFLQRWTFLCVVCLVFQVEPRTIHVLSSVPSRSCLVSAKALSKCGQSHVFANQTAILKRHDAYLEATKRTRPQVSLIANHRANNRCPSSSRTTFRSSRLQTAFEYTSITSSMVTLPF